MRKSKLIGVTFLFICFIPLNVFAGDFNGSRPLLSAVIKVFECSENGDCKQVTPESVGMPQFFIIDMDKKQILPTKASGSENTSAIENIERVDGKLILQGAEDGQKDIRDGTGWTIAISEETGKMVMTASGDQVGFVVFGACTPR
jgi:hypothetical protein